MTGLGSQAGQLRVVRFVDRMVVDWFRHPDQKVGDTTQAVMDHRELVDNIPAVLHRIADAADPLGEGLVALTHRGPEDAQAAGLELGQAGLLVGHALLHQQLGERTGMVCSAWFPPSLTVR